MKLGTFSISLRVKDVSVSHDFYEKLGFETFGGDIDRNYLILKNGDTIIGIFGDYIDKTTLTFNPGWDKDAKSVAGDWDDVRIIQKRLQDDGVTLEVTCDENTTGPAHITLLDPDGHAILIDQHR